MRRRVFRTIETSTEGKYFWTTRQDAERFRRLLLSRYGVGPARIVEARVAAAALERLPLLTMDGRPAVFVDEDDLGWFNDGMDWVLCAERSDEDG